MKLLLPISAAVVAASILTTSGLRAAEFQPAHVAADALWFAHYDAAALKASGLGKTMRTRVMEKHEARIKAATRMFSFNPMEDLDGVTVYGGGENPRKGVALIHGRFDQQHLIDLVAANDAYDAKAHGDHTVHTWVDEKHGKRSYGAFHGATLVMGEDAGLVKKALDVLGGKEKSLEPDALSVQGAPFMLALAKIDAMAKLQPMPEGRRGRHAAEWAKKLDMAVFSVGEDGDAMVAALALETKTDVDAEQIEQMVNGLIAFAQLSEERPELAKLMEGVEMDRDGASMEIRMSLPVEDIIDHMLNAKSRCGKLP